MADLPTFKFDYSIVDPSSLPQPPPPPSSVHGEVDEDDNPLPADDSFHHRDANYDMANDDDIQQSSIVNGLIAEDAALMSTQNDQLAHPPPILPSPQQPELTLKEKLVLRERQQRIETERARLKRQFALSLTNEEIDTSNNDEDTLNRNPDVIQHHLAVEPLPPGDVDYINDDDERGIEEESTRAYPDEEEAAVDEANRRLGFNMERFLRNSEFHPELEIAVEADRPLQVGEGTSDPTKGVVMERFLNEIATTASHMLIEVVPTEETVEPHRSVSFDVDALATTLDLPRVTQSESSNYQPESLLNSMHPSFGGESATGNSIISNASMRTEVNTVHDEYYSTADPLLYSTSSLENMQENDRGSTDDVSSRVSDDEPRVLRLTEADMLEMAAIDEASIGNAPPSDRDEVESYSEIGELTDFGGSGGGMHRFLSDPTFTSPDTPTTAIESASQLSQRSTIHRGGESAVSSSATNDHNDVDIVTGHLDLIDGMPIPTSDMTHYFVASASASVTANPPSEGERDDDDDEAMENVIHMIDADMAATPDHNVDILPSTCSVNDAGTKLPGSDLGSDAAGPEDASHAAIAPFVNRQRQCNPGNYSIDGSRIEHDNVVDDFDFDKDELLSPSHSRPIRGVLDNDDSFRNLPNDIWSPLGQMLVSPLQVGVERGRSMVDVKERMAVPMQFEGLDETSCNEPNLTPMEYNQSSEMTPLRLADLPPSTKLTTNTLESLTGATPVTLKSDTACNDASVVNLKTDASFLEKASSERQRALGVIVIFEIPVFILITRGADALCSVVGRARYQIILGLLPVVCAISSTAALQSREVAIDTMSSKHTSSPISYRAMFIKEATASTYNGLIMGIVLGTVACFANGFDIVFGATIFFVQLFSILSSGVIGTVVPLVYNSTIKRDGGTRSLLLVTAIQDIFSSFATMKLSYYIITVLSSNDVDTTDRCVAN